MPGLPISFGMQCWAAQKRPLELTSSVGALRRTSRGANGTKLPANIAGRRWSGRTTCDVRLTTCWLTRFHSDISDSRQPFCIITLHPNFLQHEAILAQAEIGIIGGSGLYSMPG